MLDLPGVPCAIGVSGHGLCPVRLASDLRHRQDQLRLSSRLSSGGSCPDKLRVLTFVECGAEVAALMAQAATRERIVREDTATLDHIQGAFQTVVEALVRDEGFYDSGSGGRPVRVERYAEPTLRNGGETAGVMERGTFASYLHSDKWFEAEVQAEAQPVTMSTPPRSPPPPLALVNVWMALNDAPPSNTLCFHETDAASTVRTHMLHADFSKLEGGLCVYEGGMKWGQCYVFVSGQQDTCEEVLLHGAIDVPGGGEGGGARGGEGGGGGGVAPRRVSLECRFTLHCDGD